MTENRCITVLGLAAVVGCAPSIVPPDQGVAVGNPGNLRVDLAPIDGASFQNTRIELLELSLEACDGTLVPVASNLSLDRLSEQSIEIPRGAWCGVRVDGMWLETTVAFGDEEEAYEAPELAWEVIALTGAVGAPSTDDLAIWLGAPGWASVEELERWLVDEFERDEGYSTEEVAWILLEGSTLVVDAGSDGPDTGDVVVARVDLEQIEAEPVDTGSSDGASTEPSGCGRADDGGRAVGLLVFGLLGIRRRMARTGRRRGSLVAESKGTLPR